MSTEYGEVAGISVSTFYGGTERGRMVSLYMLAELQELTLTEARELAELLMRAYRGDAR